MITVSKKLFQELTKNWKPRCINSSSILYLVGMNKSNIITQAIELETDGNGCDFMPGVDKVDLTKAYLTLAKKKLNPSGFLRLRVDSEHQDLEYAESYLSGTELAAQKARIRKDNSTLTKWLLWREGPILKTYLNTPLITIYPNLKIKAHISNKSAGNKKRYSVKTLRVQLV
jgi:hypothetical protein